MKQANVNLLWTFSFFVHFINPPPVYMCAGIHGEPVSVTGHIILSRALVTHSNQLWTLKNKARGRHCVNLSGATTALRDHAKITWIILENAWIVYYSQVFWSFFPVTEQRRLCCEWKIVSLIQIAFAEYFLFGNP